MSQLSAVDWLAGAIAAAAFIALWRFKADVIYVVAACSVVGLAVHFVSPA